MESSILEPLVSLSARIGKNLSFVQAGGGNTSVKIDGTLWIKASGKWLVNAEHDDMFVPVPMEVVRHHLQTGEERFPEYTTLSGASLRPSVETSMHAVLPHRIVVHVHSVGAISWVAQADGARAISARLSGLRWIWIPYIHPGIPLALKIQETLAERPDVLLLGNHGLVVAAPDCESAEALLLEVERRLAVSPRPATEPDLQSLRQLASGTAWQPSPDAELHSLATNPLSAEIAAGGTMYPDHCVYLGPAAPVLCNRENMTQAIDKYRDRHQYDPQYLLVPGRGVLTSDKLSRAGRELLTCLKRVIERIPEGAAVSYLDDTQVARLMNWDAEKYRIAMARQHQ